MTEASRALVPIPPDDDLKKARDLSDAKAAARREMRISSNPTNAIILQKRTNELNAQARKNREKIKLVYER